MPVHKVRGGWQWGSHGHVYETRAGAERQGRAILASGWRERRDPARAMGDLRLWKLNETTGFWDYQRSVTPETSDEWRRIFQIDDPKATFVVSKNKPVPPALRKARRDPCRHGAKCFDCAPARVATPSYTRALLSARMTASRTGRDQYIYPVGGAWTRAAGQPSRMPYVKVHPDGRAVRHERAVGDPVKKRSRRAVQRRDHGLGRSVRGGMRTDANYEEKREDRIERMRARARRLAAEGQAHYEASHRVAQRIPMGQPILIGHHSERRHRRDILRIDRSMRKGIEATRTAEVLARRAERAAKSKAVSSDDPAAVRKLKEKLEGLERDQDRMKAANKALKRGESDENLGVLLGWSPEKAAQLRKPDFAGRVGFPAYALTNAGAEIRRVKKRIAELESKAAAPPKAAETIGSVRIDESDNRVRMFFPGKPDEAVRALLKSRGFKWATSAGCWQRMASNQAWYQAREIASTLSGRGDPNQSRRWPSTSKRRFTR